MAVVEGDLQVQGTLHTRFFFPPPSSIEDAAIKLPSGQGQGVKAEKLEHKHQQIFGGDKNVVAAAIQRVMHIVRGTIANIEGFTAGVTVAAVGDAIAQVDLLKNGVSILTAPLEFDSDSGTYWASKQAGAFSNAALVRNDILEIKITVDAGGGTLPKGVWAVLDIHEDGN